MKRLFQPFLALGLTLVGVGVLVGLEVRARGASAGRLLDRSRLEALDPSRQALRADESLAHQLAAWDESVRCGRLTEEDRVSLTLQAQKDWGDIRKISPWASAAWEARQAAGWWSPPDNFASRRARVLEPALREHLRGSPGLFFPQEDSRCVLETWSEEEAREAWAVLVGRGCWPTLVDQSTETPAVFLRWRVDVPEILFWSAHRALAAAWGVGEPVPEPT